MYVVAALRVTGTALLRFAVVYFCISYMYAKSNTIGHAKSSPYSSNRLQPIGQHMVLQSVQGFIQAVCGSS